MSGLNSIFDLASKDLLYNSSLFDEGKLERVTIIKPRPLWLDFLKNLGYYRLL